MQFEKGDAVRNKKSGASYYFLNYVGDKKARVQATSLPTRVIDVNISNIEAATRQKQ